MRRAQSVQLFAATLKYTKNVPSCRHCITSFFFFLLSLVGRGQRVWHASYVVLCQKKIDFPSSDVLERTYWRGVSWCLCAWSREVPAENVRFAKKKGEITTEQQPTTGTYTNISHVFTVNMSPAKKVYTLWVSVCTCGEKCSTDGASHILFNKCDWFSVISFSPSETKRRASI